MSDFSSSRLCVLLASLVVAGSASAQDWQPLTDESALRALVSDTVLERELRDGVIAVGRYSSDGTGELEAWGETFPRQWKVRDGLICLTFESETQCIAIEKDASSDSRFRGINQVTGEIGVFTLTGEGEPTNVSAETNGSGGAAEPSAEELAKSLANPNTPLASQTFKFQFRTFDGDLPGARDETSSLVLYQPAFPFPLDNGATVFFRPAVPLIFDQPVFDPVTGHFESESGLGDIGFDLAYGRTTDTGLLWAVGVISTLPTATEPELGPDRWSLGPEVLVGKLTSKYVIGALTTHQWDIGGSGDADVNLTTVNAFYTYLPGGGWNVGTAPIMSYDHENSQWTLPINLTAGKTIVWRGRPWKLSAEINYFVDQPDTFGPEWLFGINVAPVVENVFASMSR